MLPTCVSAIRWVRTSDRRVAISIFAELCRREERGIRLQRQRQQPDGELDKPTRGKSNRASYNDTALLRRLQAFTGILTAFERIPLDRVLAQAMGEINER